MTPSLSTTIWSASVIASIWSCVTYIAVVFDSRWMRAISRRMSPRSFASRFDSGSSNRNTLGWRTTARPIATRWRWPPDSALGRRSRYGSRPRLSAVASTRRRISASGQVLDAQPERHVLEHGHVRVERVALEHHRDVALGRRQVRDVAAVDQDLTGGRLLEPGDHAQRRRLAAPARADQHDHLAGRDRQIEVGDHRHGRRRRTACGCPSARGHTRRAHEQASCQRKCLTTQAPAARSFGLATAGGCRNGQLPGHGCRVTSGKLAAARREST